MTTDEIIDTVTVTGMSTLSRNEWATVVAEVLRAHPEFAAVTIQAMQEGILAALDRKSERLADVSMGLYEALRTKPGAARREREQIIKAIEASIFHPTTWSKDAIAKEQT